MKKNHFFAMLSRMKYIDRWGLMRNTRRENLSEHSLEVALIAHALGIINHRVFGGKLDAERLAVLGMFHDAAEIITGDMPTPIKYYSPSIERAYKDVENAASKELLTGLPEEMREDYKNIIGSDKDDEPLFPYVKAADKISAYIKCIEERESGNKDFLQAEKTIYDTIVSMHLAEADYFLENFIPAYRQTIDESRV